MLILEATAAAFCKKMSPILKVLGFGITVIKIVIPIILIVYGMLDMGKAVTAGKDEEIKKSALTFGRRAIAAILVFFVPSIVGWILLLVNDSIKSANGNEVGTTDYCNCISDVTGISSASCQG